MLACTAETASGDLDWMEDDHVELEDEFSSISVGEILFLHVRRTSRFPQDAMGSVIGMASASGASTATIKYDSFGSVTSAVGASASIDSTIGTDFRFHGMQLDAASGLYHVRARTYDARSGRFTSRDPVDGLTMEPERNQPYVYGNSNPHVWTDPTGEFAMMMDLMAGISINGILQATAVASYAAILGYFVADTARDTAEQLERIRTNDRTRDRTTDVSIDIGREEIRRRRDGEEILYRYQRGDVSTGSLARKAQEALEKVGWHGVSAWAHPLLPTSPRVFALRSVIAKAFLVVDTGKAGHRTIVLPQPVTPTVRKAFNLLWTPM